ncbi:MAG: hypothetical protein ACOZIN_21075, partial [Myxococcota bacterium]
MKRLFSVGITAGFLGVLAGCGSTIGDPCTTPTDCGGQICLNRGDLTPGGYCTQQCTPADARTCPAGAVCVRDGQANNNDACYRLCRTQSDCR